MRRISSWKSGFKPLEFKFLKEAMVFASILAVTSFLALATQALLLRMNMAKENDLRRRESLGHQISLVAAVVSAKVDKMAGQMEEWARTQVSPSGGRGHSEARVLDADPILLDLSIWKQSPPASAFDLYPTPQREFWGLNPKSARNSDLEKFLKESEAEEAVLVAPAFQGHSLIHLARTLPSFLKGQKVGLIVLPLGRGPIDRVITAHFQLEPIQNALNLKGELSLQWVDDFGNALGLIQDPDSFKKVFQSIRASQLTKGYLSFQDSQKNRYLNAFQKLPLGQVALLATVSEESSLAPLRSFDQLALLSLFVSVLLIWAGGYFVFVPLRERFGVFRSSEGSAIPVEVPPVAVDPQGNSLAVSPPLEEKVERWLINNGTQIVGPFSDQEIAARLFSQELDFDCECWKEGTGNSSQIKTAGIFSGSDSPNAHLWIFDGEMIHGPMSPGFIKTALLHGAITPTHSVCEETTVNGWKLLSEFNGGALIAKVHAQPEKASLDVKETESTSNPTERELPSKRAA